MPAVDLRPSGPAAWLWPLLKPLRSRLGELAGVSLLINLLALAVPIFVLQVYDRVVFFAGMSTLQGLTIGVVIALVFDFILRQARARVLQRVALALDAEVGRRLFSKLSRLPLRDLECQTAGAWQTLRRDIDGIRNVLGGPPLLHTLDLPFAIVFVFVIAVIAAPTLPVLAVAIVAFVALGVASSSLVSRASRAEADHATARDSLLTEMIAGRTTLKALDMGARLQRVLEDRHAAAIEVSLRRGVVTDSFANLGMTLAMLTTVGMTVAGALAILAQEMTIGTLIAANMLANRITTPFNQLVPNWRAWTNFRRARQRLGALFAIADERRASDIAFPRPAGACAAEGISFRYRADREPVIVDISLALGSGLHCLAGPSGSGKTTLLKLLHGLYPPESGRVLLDGADISQFSRRDLARWIGYVPQEPVLISGSVRDNIAGFDADVADERVLRTAKLAGAHAFVADLPDGYGTHVGERGSRLSGGQRQRLAISRAFLRDPPLLLLDEPTASLDQASERHLCDVLKRMARSSTVIVVTHSPHLLSACDTLIVLDKGRIGARGQPAEVAPKLFGARHSKSAAGA